MDRFDIAALSYLQVESRVLRVLSTVFPDFASCVNAGKKALEKLGCSPALCERVRSLQKRVSVEGLRSICGKLAMQIFLESDAEYPGLLKEVESDNRPVVLFVRGTLPKGEESLKMFGVVGTRKPTAYGIMATRTFVRYLAHCKTPVVSGLAFGIDAVAHKTALEEKAHTIAVLASGLDMITPTQNKTLARDILASGGALVSEFPPGTIPTKGHFPRRNSVLAGMCWGVLVTEAASKSGTKITASWAAHYGREVFAVPGAITNPYAEGTKELINLGATLVSKPEEILAGECVKNQHSAEVLPQEEQEILRLVSDEPRTPDELQELCGVVSYSLPSVLAEMQMKGLIALTNGRYARMEFA